MQAEDYYDQLRGANLDEKEPSTSLINGLESELGKLRHEQEQLEHVLKQKKNSNKKKVVHMYDYDVRGTVPDICELRNLRMYQNQKTYEAEKNYYKMRTKSNLYRNVIGTYGHELDQIREQRNLMAKMKRN